MPGDHEGGIRTATLGGIAINHQEREDITARIRAWPVAFGTSPSEVGT